MCLAGRGRYHHVHDGPALGGGDDRGCGEDRIQTELLLRDPFDAIAEGYLHAKLSHRRVLQDQQESAAAISQLASADPAHQHAAEWGAALGALGLGRGADLHGRRGQPPHEGGARVVS